MKSTYPQKGVDSAKSTRRSSQAVAVLSGRVSLTVSSPLCHSNASGKRVTTGSLGES